MRDLMALLEDSTRPSTWRQRLAIGVVLLVVILLCGLAPGD